MSYEPVTVEQFRGLRLLPEQGEAPGSVSMLNADLSRDLTQIGTRGGMTRLGSGTATVHHIQPVEVSATTDDAVLLFRNTGSAIGVRAIETDGTVSSENTAAGTDSGSRVTSTVDLGPNPNMLMLGRNTSSLSGTMKAYSCPSNGGAITDLSATWGSPRYGATWGTRLALACFYSPSSTPASITGTPYMVVFSAPNGAYSTISADDYVNVGDGTEGITGMVSWRELLFVITQSKLFVFYGTSTDSTGGAIFNYRQIDLPSRARHTTSFGGENMVAGGDGVYLLLGDGVYRTTGDVPVLVSHEITPLFDGTGDSSMLFPSTGDWKIGYAINRLYLNYTVGATYRSLVYDTLLNEWLLWDLSGNQSAAPTNVAEFVDSSKRPTAYVAAGAKLFQLTQTGTSDDSQAIVSSYQSGFEPFGTPGQKKVAREISVEGSGSPTLSIYTDFGSTDTNAATVTLGTAPAVDDAVHRKAYRGRTFAYNLAASSGRWAVTRLTWFMRDSAAPGGRR